MLNRDKALDQALNQDAPFDIVIVGGGATGLGAAVDAASRGYRVLLVEQADFAKGTSSRSTKLVHGGVRYLRQGNVALVLEALRERGLLFRNAPHLVERMGFVIPAYSWGALPFYGIGLKVYDAMARRLGMGRSQMLGKAGTLERLPTVRTSGLKGGVLYYDGQFDDARLAINLAQTAGDHGATLLNYVRCIGIVKEAGQVRGVLLRDVESGSEFEVRARGVINATGVWVDELRKQDEPRANNIIIASQGVHLVLPERFLPGRHALMIPKTKDGRVLFAVPWKGRVVLGTTDTLVLHKELDPRAKQEERDFLMEHAREHLSEGPAESDVLSTFVGLRPLVRPERAEETAAISRDHSILVSDSGLITITGGKWTTYRKMAEEVIERAEAVAGLEPRECRTRELVVHGGDGGEQVEEDVSGIYGSDAAGIRALIRENAELGELLYPAFEIRKAEVIWHVRNEMARTVEDVLARRTRALFLNAKASMEAAEEVARIMAGELGRSLEWAEAQIAEYRLVARRYDFRDAESVGACLDH